MQSKEDILSAIRKTAKENRGNPLGVLRFEKETGIRPYDWEKYWARFGDALKEAGFSPNRLQSAHPYEFLIQKMIGLARKLGKYPTYREIQEERNNDHELPDKTVFQRLGTKAQLADKLIEYCEERTGFEDIIELCESIVEKSPVYKNLNDESMAPGEVYLFKSGHYYKIGKTNDTVRRGSELRIQLPEKMVLIHSIKTDDPSGIEAYWHRRFEAKRMNGEWFDLNSSEVKAFRRWRKIF
jgi:hypothetical protein